MDTHLPTFENSSPYRPLPRTLRSTNTRSSKSRALGSLPWVDRAFCSCRTTAYGTVSQSR
ncbi:hypothetical protein N1851_014049 [Merluccius polli]|uniref:Uncharacterized protein n=1 Tax=Merluccius polli TaxID=89951 RepID=A0AA47MU63_MERPO|nr:hypothetical protein N1851_014049 [Merluccius polli]